MPYTLLLLSREILRNMQDIRYSSSYYVLERSPTYSTVSLSYHSSRFLLPMVARRDEATRKGVEKLRMRNLRLPTHLRKRRLTGFLTLLVLVPAAAATFLHYAPTAQADPVAYFVTTGTVTFANGTIDSFVLKGTETMARTSTGELATTGTHFTSESYTKIGQTAPTGDPDVLGQTVIGSLSVNWHDISISYGTGITFTSPPVVVGVGLFYSGDSGHIQDSNLPTTVPIYTDHFIWKAYASPSGEIGVDWRACC